MTQHIGIFAKHDGCNKEFLFAVPTGMTVHKDDVLLVDTIYGPAVAVATSEIFESQDLAEIAQRYGAYLPLKEVKQVCGKTLQQYIQNRTVAQVVTKLHELTGNVDYIR